MSKLRLLATASALIGVVIAVLLASHVLAGQTAAQTPAPSQVPQPVRVSRITFASPARQSQFTGTVRPRHEAELGFRVAGKLMQRLVSVGDHVTAGEPIARLDPSDAQLDLETAEAELAAARAELHRAEADASRSQKLLASGSITQAADDRITATLAEARGRANRAQRTRDLAANRLDYMVLTADSDGVVTRELAEASQVVAAGQPVVAVAQLDQLDVVFALPEQKRSILHHSRAVAQLWEQDATRYTLSLRDVAPDVDPATRTYRVRMVMEELDQHVTLGRTVTVTFTEPASKAVTILPLSAVLNDGRGAAVWRLRPDQRSVERVPVEIAALDSAHASLRGGLSEGDLVISLGAYKIDPARAVAVVETAAIRSE